MCADLTCPVEDAEGVGEDGDEDVVVDHHVEDFVVVEDVGSIRTTKIKHLLV